jgi:C-terminal processing protease CtpA/Prc
MIIVDDSPAFNADILVGDIIEEINGITINNTNTAVEIFKDLDVKQFNLKLERNGMIVNKVITLIE